MSTSEAVTHQREETDILGHGLSDLFQSSTLQA